MMMPDDFCKYISSLEARIKILEQDKHCSMIIRHGVSNENQVPVQGKFSKIIVIGILYGGTTNTQFIDIQPRVLDDGRVVIENRPNTLQNYIWITFE